MAARDTQRFVNELDEAALERLVARLESRARDGVFARLLDNYVARLALPPSAQVLEVGCGTGAVLRSIARRDDFSGKALGVVLCGFFFVVVFGFVCCVWVVGWFVFLFG